MNQIKRIKKLSNKFKAIFALNRAISLQEVGRDKEALHLLDKHTEMLKGKFLGYHLNRGRILINADHDYKNAIEEFYQGISVIDSKRKMKPNKQEYLLAWTKYMIAWCYAELGEKNTAEHWRNEHAKHRFDYDSVPSITRNEFPMK